MKQKFKRGNLVEVLVGNKIWTKSGVHDLSPEDVGRKAIVDYSYSEKYGGDDTDRYSIIWLDTGGSVAWKRTNELKFLEDGGEHLFDTAKQNKERISRQNTNIRHIVENLENGNLSSESILLLFDMLGHNTSFHSTGEFHLLFTDWALLHPAFLHIKKAKTLKEAKLIFTEEELDSYDIEGVYNAFNHI